MRKKKRKQTEREGLAGSASRQIRPWKQPRSRATVDRVVQATMALLVHRDFDAIALDEIFQRAGTSKGAFYFRFETKTHLLRHIAEVYYARWLREFELFFQRNDIPEVSLSQFLQRFVAESARFYSSNANLIRALLKEARPGGDAVVSALVSNGSARTVQMLLAALTRRKGQVRHPAPERAIRVAALMIGTLIRQVCLFSDQGMGVNQDAIKFEVLRMARAYLGGRPGPSR